MYQSPNNQPDPNQSFYSDQTAQFSQQQPPPPPSYPQPGQYPHYPMQQPPTPQKKNIWRWYKRRSKGGKVGIGCLAIFALVITLFFCSAATVGAVQGFQGKTPTTQQPTAVPTHAAAQAVIKPTPTVARPTPTPKPTATPTPKPTAAPTAPPVVVVQPTQPPVPTQPPAPPACSGVIDAGTCYSTDSAGGTPTSTVPADFCSLVPCVSTFWKSANGSVVLCVNGKYSHSGGVSGACSRDGGVSGPLYRH